MKRSFLLIAFSTLIANAQSVELAEGFYLQYKGEVSSINQWYPQEPLYDSQENHSSYLTFTTDLTLQTDYNFDLRLKPRFYYEYGDNSGNFEQNQWRGESRTRAYWEELYLDNYGDSYEIRLGYQTWAFKTVESYSQTDVFNQTDAKIDFIDAPKYGELAVRLRWILPTSSEQVVEATYLPYLQRTYFADGKSRFNLFAGQPFALNQSGSATQFSEDLEEWTPSFLLKYNTILFESLDVSALAFYGLDRTPLLIPQIQNPNQPPSQIVSRYELAAMLGVNFQGAFGPWLVKGELMGHRFIHDQVYVAQFETNKNPAGIKHDSDPSLGITSGLEYTFYSPVIDGHDLGMIVEGIYHTDTHLKDVDQLRFIPFKNHLFMGLRYVFNTPSDRTFLLGGFTSIKNVETLAQFEYEERIWQMFMIKLRAVFVYGDKDSPLKNFEKSRRLDAELTWNF